MTIHSGNNYTREKGNFQTLQGWIDTGSKLILILNDQSIINPLLEFYGAK